MLNTRPKTNHVVFDALRLTLYNTNLNPLKCVDKNVMIPVTPCMLTVAKAMRPMYDPCFAYLH